MCGIWAALFGIGAPAQTSATNAVIQRCVKQLEPRGPEYTAVKFLDSKHVVLGFTRLAINGLTPAGNQPFEHDGRSVVCNGEIYNHRELAARWGLPVHEGSSDCEVIPLLAGRIGMTELCRTLDGVFAFVLVDGDAVYVARDPYGVRPLFQAHLRASNAVVWSSEIKGLPPGCTDIQPFPPGTWRQYALDGALVREVRYHTVPHVKLAAFEDRGAARAALRAALVSAVRKRLLSDRPIGALLSGGVDSSLVAAIAARELAAAKSGGGTKLHTFSIGMPGSTDLAYAQRVADKIGSIHHSVVVSPQDFLDAIPAVIHDIESYDVTTVRASVGNWLIGKYIREHTDIKVVFNGDGSDEIGGGYIYSYAAPSDEDFEAESDRLLDELHMYDVLRSDRSMAAHGLEARTPFLDKNVVATWRALPTAFRRPRAGEQVEKAILREAFADDDYLPTEVLWRKKEAFSDGVSSTEDSWYKRCTDAARAAGVTQDRVHEMTRDWHNPPRTEEAYHYRQLFEAQYGAGAAGVIPHMWMPRWIAGATDPSARTLKELYSV
jgi:asparagine synthase (glutamine-hydrolysing)